MSHFLLMVLYALVVSAFFALLWRHRRRDRWALFLKLFVGLVVGALVVAWLMLPVPPGPPAPIP